MFFFEFYFNFFRNMLNSFAKSYNYKIPISIGLNNMK